MTYDGIVSRYLNRPLSRPLARALRRTPLTPNTVTSFTLLLALASGGAMAAGWNIAGGIAIQAVSVLDGVDGELARLKNMATRFGGVFDAVTDRYADAAILAGMTVFAVRFEGHPHPEFVGMLALSAALIVSYSRARIEADLPDVIESGRLDSVFGLASRDVRSLIAAIGTVVGQCYWTLIVLAAVSALTVAWRLVYLRVTVGSRRFPTET
ncbi:MAG: CDP-alcohol phosphatidyltransferase family protein [Dehalococcoidia bacterium]|uniref:CDP-alcohol phosphatidyltransferase family protein n=1 Tax=Candidatus Amarobacter glycogenicus TaxID=3140699 RepID=UPI0031367A1F|nr:CDP-alcohol phosphatidyltransferase family protein [Dehalococcoidia bacterium]